MSTPTLSKKSLTVPATALLVLGILVAVNFLAHPLRNLRTDFTEGKIYSLSPGSKDLLKNLQRPVELKFYYSRDDADMPVYLKQYAARVEDLLHEYAAVGGKKVKLTVIHPTPLSDDEEWARKYGLQAVDNGEYGTDSFFLGVVAVSGSHESVLPFLNPNQESRLEYNLSRMVSEVTRKAPPKIGVYSSLPVFGQPQMRMPQGRNGSQPWLVMQELKGLVTLQKIDSLDNPLPADLDALWVVHPKNLDEKALYTLDQYVVGGGKLLVSVDPLCLADQFSQEGQQMGMGGNFSSDLPTLFKHWGISYDSSKVLADQELAAAGTARGSGMRNPTWLLARSENLNQDEIPTRDLEVIQLGLSGAFTVKAPDGIHVIPLITSSNANALVNASMVEMNNPAALMNNLHHTDTKRMMAARLVGTFSSAFKKAPEGMAESQYLQQGTQPGQVVMIADVDWMVDQMVARPVNLMGQEVLEPSGDNLALFLNLSEQSSGNADLIGLRSRGKFERPFTVVNNMLRVAESASQKEITSLQIEIRQAQSRVEQIATSTGDAQSLTLNQTLHDEQAALQEQIFQASRRLRDIERNRRRDVESLKFRLQVLNILAVPFLVGAAGLSFGLIRRRRSNANAAA